MSNRVRNTIIWSMSVSFLMLIIDQVIKIWIKTNMVEHQMFDITSWFKIYFIENEGMAYGITIGSKIFLTIFRIVAMSFLAYYIIKLIKIKNWSKGFILALSLILSGGIGNIVDSLFYGEVFTSSIGQVAEFVSWGQGYSTFLKGNVVDMFYFPMIETNWPEWIPYLGGDKFIFFRPVFNFADACISVGVFLCIIFYIKDLGKAFDILSKKENNEKENNK